MSSVLLGTSGWQHRQWQESFYPRDLSRREQLGFYAGQFDCVEVAESFYRLPERHTFAAWVQDTPEGFRFAVVAPRIITHYKKLKHCENQVDTLITRLQGLGEKIGPVVFRLPTRWRCNLRRLEEFGTRLPDHLSYVFELPDESWHVREVFHLMAHFGFAFTVPRPSTRKTLPVTAGFVYLRLPAPVTSPTGSFHPQTLRGWAGRVHGWSRQGKAVYVLFGGDDADAVLKNARRIRKYVHPEGR